MKKIIAMLLAVVMVLSLAACGGEGGAAEADGTYKVAFILNCSISDGGWGTACYSELVAGTFMK